MNSETRVKDAYLNGALCGSFLEIELFLRFKENFNILHAFPLINHLTTTNYKIIKTVMPPSNASNLHKLIIYRIKQPFLDCISPSYYVSALFVI